MQIIINYFIFLHLIKSRLVMSFANKYYQRYNAFDSFISEKPHPELGICIVIPSYKEPAIIPTLTSLLNCTKPSCAVEIIVAVNSPDNATNEALLSNQKTIEDIITFSTKHSEETFRIYYTHVPDLKKKHAGAGWARKVGMDEALRRFDAIENPEGLIVGFDADSTCSKNYLVEIEKHFHRYKKCDGATLNFEHPLSGNDYPKEFYEGITLYELHLRYLNQALVYTGFPYAFHTIGSAFAVRAQAYMQQGGMNRRTAGEDFYFLHKIIATGKFMNLPTATVFPSPRPSMRVPFGTGATITKMIEQNDFSYQTYNIEVFYLLKTFFTEIPQLYISDTVESVDQNQCLSDFLSQNDFTNSLIEIRKNSASEKAFIKRFYNWFNAFRVVKFLNYSHETRFTKQDVTNAALQLIHIHNNDFSSTDKIELLKWFRKYETNI